MKKNTFVVHVVTIEIWLVVVQVGRKSSAFIQVSAVTVFTPSHSQVILSDRCQ